MDENWVRRLREELAKPLPGVDAQLRMSPPVKRPVAADKPIRNSGVLLLLYPRGGNVHTVFIKRTVYEGVHSGQISLPGGMFKKSDGDLSNTALRETREETGISSDEVHIIGRLTCLHIPVSNINVFPFVAADNKCPDFIPDATEVQYLIETSLDELLNPMNCKTGIIQIAGNEIEVPYFDIRGNRVWGATAMIVSEFLAIAERVTRDE